MGSLEQVKKINFTQNRLTRKKSSNSESIRTQPVPGARPVFLVRIRSVCGAGLAFAAADGTADRTRTGDGKSKGGMQVLRAGCTAG